MTDTTAAAHPLDGHEIILAEIKALNENLAKVQEKVDAIAVACKC